MTKDQWLKAVVQELKKAQWEYEELSNHYNFMQAFERGLTPQQAWNECCDWLNLGEEIEVTIPQHAPTKHGH
jgi:hypothetical protein